MIIWIANRFKFYRPSKQVIEEATTRAMKTTKHVCIECFKEFTKNYDVRTQVSEIKIPTLIVSGKKDKSTPLRMAQYLNREIGGSKLRIVPNSGHSVMIEKPEKLNKALKEFINISI